jgi:hypothetical protein
MRHPAADLPDLPRHNVVQPQKIHVAPVGEGIVAHAGTAAFVPRSNGAGTLMHPPILFET